MMKGLIFQLKSVRKDKFCIMSFLLPILVAIVLNFVGVFDLSSLGELHFGVLENDLPKQTVIWLERYGTVDVNKSMDELITSVNDPSTNLIGVLSDGNNIKTIISGDELELFRETANTLPVLFKQRETAEKIHVSVLERADLMSGFQNIFIAVTLIVAMFMGCTFNAMNIISEKEEGVSLINEVLPISRSQYIIQKIFIGFVFGALSAVITAMICFRLSLQTMLLMLALIILSSFVSALIGLFIGRFSEGLMVGVVYIKIIMIAFMAVPLLKYLLGFGGGTSFLCYLVPSTAAFEGIMALLIGNNMPIGRSFLILIAHGVAWFFLYIVLSPNKSR
jgi:ABC-type multidrug transport system permease subunit